jgi:hypothetical protein
MELLPCRNRQLRWEGRQRLSVTSQCSEVATPQLQGAGNIGSSPQKR